MSLPSFITHMSSVYMCSVLYVYTIPYVCVLPFSMSYMAHDHMSLV